MSEAGPSSDPKHPEVLEYATPATNGFRNPLATAALSCCLLFLVAVGLACATDIGVLSVLLVLFSALAAFAFAIAAAFVASRRRQSTRGTTSLILLASLELAGVLAVAFILPNTGRSREGANRVKCMNNLKQIGQAMMLYARGDKGQFPPSFDELLLSGDLDASCLVCPSSNDDKAPGATTREIIKNLHSRSCYCSYVYIGGGVTTAALNTHVVAYEPLKNHHNQGMNVLFADGHVEWFTASDAKYFFSELSQGYNPVRLKSPPTQP